LGHIRFVVRTRLHLLAVAAVSVASGVCALAAGAATPRVDVPGSTLEIDAASGELEDGSLIVRGAAGGRLAVRLDAGSAPLLQQGLAVLRLTSTRVAGLAVADPLPPLARKATVSGPAPVRLVVRVRVPDGTPAGIYEGRLAFASNGGRFASVPVRVRVFGVQLPARDDPTAFRTLFLVQPQTYVAAVIARSGLESGNVAPGITDRLYSFLSDYRVSPGDWGFGTPWPDGYENRPGWWRAAATRMESEGAYPFSTMRIPLGTQRAPASRTGQSARAPGGWAAYLKDHVLPFWRAHGWLDRALVWGWDEPGPVYSRRYAAPQACAAHAAGVTYLTTGAPALRIPARSVTIPWGQGMRSFTIRAHGVDNGFLWDDQGCDDVDVWAVLSRRFYGSFATPVEHAAHIDAARELHTAIRAARARGAAIWSFTYESPAGRDSPGYAATEPATDARVFALWNALEGIDGTLYADGMVSYGGLDPYTGLTQHGQHVLVYPALASADEPVSSLRLENLRDGIEDADLARMVVAQRGRAALLAILARERIFSIRGSRVLLGCTSGCDLVTTTKYAWPRYRRDAGTGAALGRVHTALLRALAPVPE
jgi:hypothetical protein